MYSTWRARALPRAGCPIQKSPDHRLLPTPRRLSQVAASFFGSWCLGIHLGPLLACSTYNHSSIAEEVVVGHVEFRTFNSKEDPVRAPQNLRFCEDPTKNATDFHRELSRLPVIFR